MMITRSYFTWSYPAEKFSGAVWAHTSSIKAEQRMSLTPCVKAPAA
jgi:hypothetical protein